MPSAHCVMTVTGSKWHRARVLCRSLAIVTLVLGAGCDEATPTGPGVPLNQQFTLGPGESVWITDASITVEMLRVSGDSRCPADAFCIQGGDALVHIVVRGGATSGYELHTGDAARSSIRHGAVRIALTDLQPYPFSSRTIRPDEYRATFTASAS